MPRVPSTYNASIHAKPYGKRNTASGKLPPYPPREHCCAYPGCDWSFDRASDLDRHGDIHLTKAERDAKKLPCPYEGCTYRTLQRVNLKTHMNTHTGDKPFECPTPGCTYASSDRSCLYRHRQSHHGYEGDEDSKRRRKASKRMISVNPDDLFAFPSPSSSGSSSYAASSCPSPSPVAETLPESDSFSYSPPRNSWNWDPIFESAITQLSMGPLDCDSAPALIPRDHTYQPAHLLEAELEAMLLSIASDADFMVQNINPKSDLDSEHLCPTEPLLSNPALAPSESASEAAYEEWYARQQVYLPGEWLDAGMAYCQ
ncbi:C2H2-type domain-containing protein [Mycena chlorophos]|uniref:C2H2-type domain-containing protein n=1 Tax=Mycena chlorophos TaxID=658473 RepID=A0A8H6TIY1_MYCCL|nr:C2H2-type domain-containing protein [Mycena chlorophos]